MEVCRQRLFCDFFLIVRQSITTRHLQKLYLKSVSVQTVVKYAKKELKGRFLFVSITQKNPLIVKEQGAFSAGGVTIHADGPAFDPINPMDPYAPPENLLIMKQTGQSLRGDAAHVSYQIPVNPRKLPLVFLHGGFQTSKCWQTTPDGREGFQNIFLRRDFSVYLVDQPRRGCASRSTVTDIVPVMPDDETQFNIFRLGLWPNFYDGVQFSREPETLDQFYHMMTNNHGPYDADLISTTMAAVFDKVGDGVLVTHSQSGGLGWLTATKSEKVKAIVAYEPGSCFLFPEGEVPDPITCYLPWDVLPASAAPKEEFMKLTKIPIIIYYGDNIAKEPCNELGRDHWRMRAEMAKLWVEKINSYGGDAELVMLPDIGIFGNTHCIFSDLNNLEVAEVLSEWLHEKDLD